MRARKIDNSFLKIALWIISFYFFISEFIYLSSGGAPRWSLFSTQLPSINDLRVILVLAVLPILYLFKVVDLFFKYFNIETEGSVTVKVVLLLGSFFYKILSSVIIILIILELIKAIN